MQYFNNKNNSYNIITLLLLLLSISSFAQITPPGLGSEINTAEWLALALKQNLNKSKTVSSTTYVGHSSSSNIDYSNPFKQNALYVVNEEISHHFKKHWKYSGALSYRWQNFYDHTSPYHKNTSRSRQEIRTYGRFSYLTKINTLDFSLTYRPELRFFYTSNFTPYQKSIQFRSRLAGKLSAPLNAKKTKKLIFATELLFSTSKAKEWSKWAYHESRFSIYYSVFFPKQKFIVNLGYMNNLLGADFSKDTHYFAFDITIKNPFHS